MRIENGRIFIGGVPAAEIAAIYGTPTYAYDERRIRENYRRAYKAFSAHYPDFRFFYAVKACSNPAIAHILRQEGAGIDAASVNEILLARDIGLSGHDVMFSGNFLSDEDIARGLASGVIFNLDDISLLPRVLRHGTPETLAFRINPGYGKSELGDYVTNAGPGAKFGLHPDMAMEAFRQAREAGVRRFGVHMMPGSCMSEPDYFAHVTRLLMDIVGKVGRALAIDFEFIDIGGGLGIPYRPGAPALDIERTAMLVAQAFKDKIAEHGLRPPRLMMEPARYFVGDAGFVIGRVHCVKRSYAKIIGTDVGMNILARPALYGAYHRVFFDGREGGPTEPAGLCGQICENTDYWIKERDFPAAVAEGDVLVVADAGAYGYGMSYPYNGRLRAAEVLVDDTAHTLIRRRETYEDLIRGCLVPPRLQA